MDSGPEKTGYVYTNFNYTSPHKRLYISVVEQHICIGSVMSMAYGLMYFVDSWTGLADSD